MDLTTRRHACCSTSWRRRPATGNAKQNDTNLRQPNNNPEPALRGTAAVLRALNYFRRFAAECPDAVALIQEAEAGSARRVALHIFFESADVALRDMEREEREVAQGLAVYSPHQPDRAKILRVLKGHCAKLHLWQRARKLTLRAADSGFFCGFLAVLDTLLLAPPGIEVEVDWRLRGDERHFTYTPPKAGQCVWQCLFAPVHIAGGDFGGGDLSHLPPLPPGMPDTFECEARFNFYLTARFRKFFVKSVHCDLMRRLYHDVYARHVRLTHPTLKAVCEEGLGAELRANGRCLGIHKRVDTPGTVEYQSSVKRVFGCADFIAAARSIMARSSPPLEVVFLATDDAHAEASFRTAFGQNLRVRSGVQRVAGGLNADGTLNEVHIRSPHNPTCTVGDAVDVVCDALLLASCDTVLHMDSNVTSAVALINPDATMVHIADAMAMGARR